MLFSLHCVNLVALPILVAVASFTVNFMNKNIKKTKTNIQCMQQQFSHLGDFFLGDYILWGLCSQEFCPIIYLEIVLLSFNL